MASQRREWLERNGRCIIHSSHKGSNICWRLENIKLPILLGYLVTCITPYQTQRCNNERKIHVLFMVISWWSKNWNQWSRAVNLGGYMFWKKSVSFTSPLNFTYKANPLQSSLADGFAVTMVPHAYSLVMGKALIVDASTLFLLKNKVL